MTIAVQWWKIAITPTAAARAFPWLTPEERSRAQRLTNAGYRERFIAARAGLRALLAERLGCHPAAVVFAYQPEGKPYLSGGEWHFNLSHSGDYALAAFSRDSEVGADLEHERPRLDALGIAHRFFTRNERDWLAAQPEVARARAFVRLWSCKEAWLKLTGKGLALPLDQVEVSFNPDARIAADGRSWPVQELPILDSFAAAVVTSQPHPPATPTWIDWQRLVGSFGID